MVKYLIMLTILLSTAVSLAGGMEDDPIIAKVMVDQLERRFTDGDDALVLEAQAWMGKDLHKLWLKADIEQVKGDTEELELQALYSRAIDPYWDFQIGWRHDQKPGPERDWLVLGLQGLAPYWFEVDASLFIAESGQKNLRLQFEYEWMLSQKWVLSPELEVNFYTDDEADIAQGSGLSDVELGLRLRYEIRREFAPYIGFNWSKSYGNTADYRRQEGEDTSDLQWVIGLRAWF